jgi:hypothetical protein
MRSIFLISERENVAAELTNEVFGQRTHSELHIDNAQEVDGLGLSFVVLRMDFGRIAQKAKVYDSA